MIVTFYAHSGGAGRSGAVVNIAVLLANAGKRVLVLDLDAPSLRPYLEPLFEPATRSPVTLAEPLRIGEGFAVPGGLIDYVGAEEFDGTAWFDAVQLRTDLLQRPYEYILIDSPSGASGLTDAITLTVPDVLVVAYHLSSRSIRGGLYQARRVKGLAAQRERDLMVRPVPMRIDRNATGKAALKRVTARHRFQWLLNDMSAQEQAKYWHDVEIPYVPDYAYDENIVTMDDPSASPETRMLQSAYVSLASRVCALSARELAREVPAATRARYQERQTSQSDAAGSITIAHTLADRPWAEWAAGELSRTGLPVHRISLGPDCLEALTQAEAILLILSAHFAASPFLQALTDAVDRRIEQSDPPVLGIAVDGADSAWAQRMPIATVSIAGMSGAQAQAELLDFFAPGQPGSSSGVHGAAGRTRLPTERSDSLVSNVFPPYTPFLGRDEALDAIRDHFDRPGVIRDPLLVLGPPGSGKTRIADEYAARFGAWYDAVWRIAGDSPQSIERSLAELAAAAQLLGDEPATAAMKWLTTTARRALLIVDDLRSGHALADLVPAGAQAHILVTARSQVIEHCQVVELGELPAEQAALLIGRLVPEAYPDSTAALADSTGGLPLTVVLAAALVRSLAATVTLAAHPGTTDPVASAAAEFIRQLTSDGQEQESRQDAAGPPQDDASAGPDQDREQDQPQLLDRIVALIYEHLEHTDWGAAAQRLLETLAYLAPEGVWTDLIRSAPFLDYLIRVEPRLSDPVTLDSVLFQLADAGLVQRVRAPRDLTGMHPRVGEAVRRLLSASGKEAEIRRRTVLLLSGCAPIGIDEDTRRGSDLYAELQRHIDVLDVARHTDRPVRRWLVGQVRYLWQRGAASWPQAMSLAQDLQTHWQQALPACEQDPEYLALLTQKANIHRSANQFAEAEQTDRLALEQQRTTLGVQHLRTLMTARSYGADLRQSGAFEGALIEDASTLRGFRHALGDAHEITVSAYRNLGMSEFLAGHPLAALETAQQAYERSLPLARDRPDFRGWVLTHLGIYLREVDRLEESADRLLAAQNELDRLTRRRQMSHDNLILFECRAAFAATTRRLEAPDLPAARSLLDLARKTFGDEHACSLLCLSGAAAAHHWAGGHTEAIRMAHDCLEGHKRLFADDHPYVGVCAVNLAAYASAGGQMTLARDMSSHAARLLERRLGPEHPWSAIATLNRVWIAAVSGQPVQARREVEAAILALEARRGPACPITRLASNVLRDADAPQLVARARSVKQCPHQFEIDLAFA